MPVNQLSSRKATWIGAPPSASTHRARASDKLSNSRPSLCQPAQRWPPPTPSETAPAPPSSVFWASWLGLVWCYCRPGGTTLHSARVLGLGAAARRGSSARCRRARQGHFECSKGTTRRQLTPHSPHLELNTFSPSARSAADAGAGLANATTSAASAAAAAAPAPATRRSGTAAAAREEATCARGFACSVFHRRSWLGCCVWGAWQQAAGAQGCAWGRPHPS